MKVRPVSRRLVVNTSIRGTRRASQLMLGSAVVAAMASSAAMAADVIKLDTADALETAAGWSGGVLPGASDVAVFDSTLSTNLAFTLGANQTWDGIRIANPAGPITINGTAILTTRGSGLNMSAATQNLTINTPWVLRGTSPYVNFNLAAGRTLTTAQLPTKVGGGSVDAYSLVKYSTTGTFQLGPVAASTVLTNTQGNPYALYGDNDWAARDASGVVVAATYTSGGTGLAAGTNVDVTADMAGPNAVDIASLRFNDPTPRTVAISTSGTSRTSTVRGILMTANSGGGAIVNTGAGLTANNGFIRPARPGNSTVNGVPVGVINTAFPIIQNSTIGDLTISANVGNISSGTATVGTQVVKYGAGKVILLAANAYPAGTIIQEGTIEVGGANGTLGGGAITNNAALILNRTAGTLTLNQVISGAGSMTFAGTGSYVLGGANTYTAANQLNGGLVEATTAASLGTSNTLNFNGGGYRYNAAYTPDLSTFTTTIGAGGATIDTNGVNVAFAGPIGAGGAGGLTKAGAGTLTFNAANTYAGPTTVNGGTLALNASIQGSAIVNSGAGLIGVGPIAGSLTSNAGSISPGNAGVGTLTSSGLTLGTGSLLNLEFGTGNDQLNASGGTVTLNGGALTLLQAGSPSAFSTAGTYDIITGVGSLAGTGLSALSIANPQPGFLYTFNQVGNAVKLNIAINGVVTGWAVDADGSWATAGNWSSGIPNAAGDAATFGAVATAPRTVTLDGNRTVGGIIFSNANGYTLTAGSVPGSTLTLNGNLVPTAQVKANSGSHTIAVPVSITSTTTEVEVATGASLTLSGAVTGGSNIVKIGNGTLTLSNASNGYTGSTSVNGGVLAVGGIGSLGTNAALNLSGGGLVRYAAGMTNDLSTAKTIVLGAGGGGIDTNGNDVTFNTAISGTGGLVKAGAGKLTLVAANTHTGATVVNGGTLSVPSNAQLGDPAIGAGITVNGGVLEATATMSTADGGIARVLTAGAAGAGISVTPGSVLTLAGGATGTGLITVDGGGTAVLSVAGTTSGGYKLVNGSSLTQSVNASLGSSQVEFVNGTLNIAATSLSGNTMNVTGTGIINAGAAVGTPILGPVIGSGDLTVNLSAGILDLGGAMTGFTGTVRLVNAGSGAVRLNGTGLGAGLTLDIGAGVSVGRRNTTLSFPIGALTGSGTLTAAGANIGTPATPPQITTYVIGGKNVDATFDGIIADNVNGTTVAVEWRTAITKTGTGKQVLNGENYYSGVTIVQAGTLQLGKNAYTPVLGGSTPIVGFPIPEASGADIQGGKLVFDYSDGGTNPAATVASILDTGYDQATKFSTGQIRSTTLAANRILGWKDDAALSQVTVMYTLPGDATLDGTVNFDDLLKLAASYNSSSSWAGGDFNYDATVNFDDLLVLAANYNQVLTGSFGGDWALAQAAVPEPTVLTVAGAAAAMGLRRRRR